MSTYDYFFLRLTISLAMLTLHLCQKGVMTCTPRARDEIYVFGGGEELDDGMFFRPGRREREEDE